ncbi:SDR family NAD(P)-dependent oxidoreductase [Ruminococcus sp.]|jgi:NAD(P)-dependent dehydrogenase (short-subunit alcohol dehydrogenase family)
MNQWERKTVLVMGAAGGIGSIIVRMLESYYRILAVDKDPRVFDLAQDENIHVLQLDLQKLDDRQSLKAVLDTIPGLYGAVIATGIMIPGSVMELSEEDWSKTIDINVTMVYHLVKLLIPYLVKEKTSHIIALASHLGTVGSYNLAAYSTSKAAVIELIKCIALDYGDQGVIANCISPGFVKTEMLNCAMRQFATNKKWMFASGGLPKQHIDPQDIAGMVSFLLQQTCMNGENVIIDAGYTVR